MCLDHLVSISETQIKLMAFGKIKFRSSVFEARNVKKSLLRIYFLDGK